MDDILILQLLYGLIVFMIVFIVSLFFFNRNKIKEWDDKFIKFLKGKGKLDEGFVYEIPKASYSIVRTVAGQVIEEQSFHTSSTTIQEALEGVAWLKLLNEGKLELKDDKK